MKQAVAVLLGLFTLASVLHFIKTAPHYLHLVAATSDAEAAGSLMGGIIWPIVFGAISVHLWRSGVRDTAERDAKARHNPRPTNAPPIPQARADDANEPGSPER